MASAQAVFQLGKLPSINRPTTCHDIVSHRHNRMDPVDTMWKSS